MRDTSDAAVKLSVRTEDRAMILENRSWRMLSVVSRAMEEASRLA